MIKAEDILNKTDGGLRIILDLYPQARAALEGKKHLPSEMRRRLLPHFANIIRKGTDEFGK